MKYLLVTNDFPPKVGGIQSYLWELWRRLPAGSTAVLTTRRKGAESFDAASPVRVVRDRARWLLPTGALVRRIDRLADEMGADLVLLDPAFPLGLLGPRLRCPYGVIVHGAEVTVPGRLPGSRRALGRVLRSARVVVAAGHYPAAEAERAAGVALPTIVIPPGVDADRFAPLDAAARAAARRRFGLDPDATVVVGLSRLVPRKGFDVLVRSASELTGSRPDLQVVVAGTGRDRSRLERLTDRMSAPVRFAGRVADEDLPALLGCADAFAMLCRDRWFGLEQEGFGIVFLEAAACALPVVAGRSGGSHEAVCDGVDGVVVDDPGDVVAVTDALAHLLDDADRARRWGIAGRDRVLREHDHDRLAARLHEQLSALDLTTGRER